MMQSQEAETQPIEEIGIVYGENFNMLEIRPPIMVGSNVLNKVIGMDIVNDLAGYFGDNTKFRLRNFEEPGRLVSLQEFRAEIKRLAGQKEAD